MVLGLNLFLFVYHAFVVLNLLSQIEVVLVLDGTLLSQALNVFLYDRVFVFNLVDLV